MGERYPCPHCGNDIAWIVTAARAEAAKYREALEKISAARGEVNPNNYNWDDVQACSASLIDCTVTAMEALSTPASDWLERNYVKRESFDTINEQLILVSGQLATTEAERDGLAAALEKAIQPPPSTKGLDWTYGYATAMREVAQKTGIAERAAILARIRREAKAEALREAAGKAKSHRSECIHYAELERMAEEEDHA